VPEEWQKNEIDEIKRKEEPEKEAALTIIRIRKAEKVEMKEQTFNRRSRFVLIGA
jgi:hypothetical protein